MIKEIIPGVRFSQVTSGSLNRLKFYNCSNVAQNIPNRVHSNDKNSTQWKDRIDTGEMYFVIILFILLCAHQCSQLSTSASCLDLTSRVIFGYSVFARIYIFRAFVLYFVWDWVLLAYTAEAISKRSGAHSTHRTQETAIEKHNTADA